MARASSTKETSRSRAGTARRTANRELVDFQRLAQEAVASAVHRNKAVEAYLAPIDALHARHPVPFPPDQQFLDYGRDYTSAYRDVAREIGGVLFDRLTPADRYLDPWPDFDPALLSSPKLLVYVADRPDAVSPPSCATRSNGPTRSRTRSTSSRAGPWHAGATT